MANSTKAAAPAKPHPDFPLTPRGDGRWCKKIRGQFHYFVGTADEALKEWLRVKDYLLAGRTPPPRDDEAVTLVELVDKFCVHKLARLQSGELSQRTYDRYHATGRMLLDHFGERRRVDDLRPEDFEGLRATMAKRWGPVALGNEIQIVRSIFVYGFKMELLDRPARFGAAFDKPSAKVLRVKRAENGPRDFTADQVKALLRHARPAMRAMILLGVNGGLGNTDVAELTADRVDLNGGWLDYPRGKTGIDRRIPLWPETVKAVREAIAKRVDHKSPDDSSLLFIGARGQGYIGGNSYRVGQEFAGVAKAAGIEGRAFYDLRRTFQTVAEGVRDLSAVQAIMGHSPPESDMSARYRQRVDDVRLRAVADSVRAWLYPPKRQKSCGT